MLNFMQQVIIDEMKESQAAIDAGNLENEEHQQGWHDCLRHLLIRCQELKEVADMSQAEAKSWLIHNDKEGAAYWHEKPDTTDFREAVAQNKVDFGF